MYRRQGQNCHKLKSYTFKSNKRYTVRTQYFKLSYFEFLLKLKTIPRGIVLQSFTRAILNSRYFELHAFFVSPVITTQQQGSTVPVLTMTRKSACVPVKTGISIGTLTEYGLLRRTPTVGNNMTIFTFTLFILTM